MFRTLFKFRDWRAIVTKHYTSLSNTFEGKPAGEYVSEDSIRRRKLVAHYIYNLIFAFLVALTLTNSERQSLQRFRLEVGDIADEDILSPISAEMEPKRLARMARDEITRSVPPVFDYDDTAIESWLRRWQRAFQRARAELYTGRSRKSTVSFETLSQLLLEITGQNVPLAELTLLHQTKFSEGAERTFDSFGKQLLGRLIASTNLFPQYNNTGISVRLVNQGFRETVIHDVTRVWSIDQTGEFLSQIVAHRRSGQELHAQLVTQVMGQVIVPNLKLNKTLTQRRIEKAIASSRPSQLSIKKGETIARRGEQISEQHAEILSHLKYLTSPASSAKRFSLSLLLLFIFFSVLFRMNITGRAFWNLSLKDSLVFLLITLLTFLAVKHVLPLLRLFFAPLNMGFGIEYLVPISAGGIIVHLTMGKETAFTYAMLVSIVVGYLLDRNFYFTVYTFAVTASAIQSIRSCKQRTDLFRCGAWSGLIGALLVLAFSLTQTLGFHTIQWTSLGITLALAFLSGILAAIFASIMITVCEAVFGYTTSLKLLELSNFNHPLLHTLMMKAPGTYHHSVIVGSLAEIAADRIKANSLLARVSAYYHDIGKMTKPLYFIENQSPNHNPHDKLSPSMSAKILFSHVKAGVKLGQEYSLGLKINDIIQQHHGTTLVSYFYNKAKQNEDPELQLIGEADFRYPGPRPQTREAAIVMVADACEAATRSILEPTPAKIRSMVHNIINKRFLEEQFNECDLTVSDLRVCEECFTRTLVSLYHHRIEYPGQRNVIPRQYPNGSNNQHHGRKAG